MTLDSCCPKSPRGHPRTGPGLIVGDIVVAIGETAVVDAESVPAAVLRLNPGQAVEVAILRGGEPRHFTVVPTEHAVTDGQGARLRVLVVAAYPALRAGLVSLLASDRLLGSDSGGRVGARRDAGAAPSAIVVDYSAGEPEEILSITEAFPGNPARHDRRRPRDRRARASPALRSPISPATSTRRRWPRRSAPPPPGSSCSTRPWPERPASTPTPAPARTRRR